SARIGPAGFLRLLLHLLAHFLHVLPGAAHGVAGDEEVGAEQREDCQGNDALHGTLLWNGWDRGGESTARAPNETRRSVNAACNRSSPLRYRYAMCSMHREPAGRFPSWKMGPF